MKTGESGCSIFYPPFFCHSSADRAISVGPVAQTRCRSWFSDDLTLISAVMPDLSTPGEQVRHNRRSLKIAQPMTRQGFEHAQAIDCRPRYRICLA